MLHVNKQHPVLLYWLWRLIINEEWQITIQSNKFSCSYPMRRCHGQAPHTMNERSATPYFIHPILCSKIWDHHHCNKDPHWTTILLTLFKQVRLCFYASISVSLLSWHKSTPSSLTAVWQQPLLKCSDHLINIKILLSKQGILLILFPLTKLCSRVMELVGRIHCSSFRVSSVHSDDGPLNAYWLSLSLK